MKTVQKILKVPREDLPSNGIGYLVKLRKFSKYARLTTFEDRVDGVVSKIINPDKRIVEIILV